MTDPAKALQDIPPLPQRKDGMTDLDLLAAASAAGPLATNRLGTVIGFSLAHMEQVHDDRVTRQMGTELQEAMGVASGPVHDWVREALLFNDGPDHRCRRAPLARTFAAPRIVAERTAIRARCERLIAPLVGAGPVDFTEAVAGPLPAGVIAAILGIAEQDCGAFATLVYRAMRALSPARPEVMADATEAMAGLAHYADALLDERRAAPRDDFLTAYLAATAEGPLAPEAARAQIVALILAGSDTTRGALTATVSALLDHTEAWEALVAAPEALAPGAVEEGLRFDPVVGSLARVTHVEADFGGVTLPAGTIVAAAMITALRDPAVYADPNRFDPARSDHPKWHPVFGRGAHRCLGETLARIELEEALKTLARLAPRARLAGPPVRLTGLGATRRTPPLMVTLAA